VVSRASSAILALPLEQRKTCDHAKPSEYRRWNFGISRNPREIAESVEHLDKFEYPEPAEYCHWRLQRSRALEESEYPKRFEYRHSSVRSQLSLWGSPSMVS
jgi:hypothetical protein